MNNFLSWILFGIMAGVIASIIEGRPTSTAFLGSLVLGILGAVVGGLLADLVIYGGEATFSFNLTSLLVASVGAMFLLFVSKLFREE